MIEWVKGYAEQREKEYVFASELPAWLQARIAAAKEDPENYNSENQWRGFALLKVPFCQVNIDALDARAFQGENPDVFPVKLKRGETVTFSADETVVRITFDIDIVFLFGEGESPVQSPVHTGLEYLRLIPSEVAAQELEALLKAEADQRAIEQLITARAVSRILTLDAVTGLKRPEATQPETK